MARSIGRDLRGATELQRRPICWKFGQYRGAGPRGVLIGHAGWEQSVRLAYRQARTEAKAASSLRSISRLNSSSVRRRVVGASRLPPARDVVMDVVSGPSRTSSQRMKSGSAACSRPRTCRKASSSASIVSGSTTRSLSGPGSLCEHRRLLRGPLLLDCAGLGQAL
eukprot:scaffold58910_cov65-Phaeocystis_antarctica.AAC.6